MELTKSDRDPLRKFFEAFNLTPFKHWVSNQDLLAVARHQGADNFSPADLPDLWRFDRCPLLTPEYRAAWYHGFYSAAAWFLIDRVMQLQYPTTIGVTPVAELQRLNLEHLLPWYEQASEQQLRRVPLGRTILKVISDESQS